MPAKGAISALLEWVNSKGGMPGSLGLPDVVATVDVGRQVRQQVLLVGRRLRPVHSEVVMRIADRNLRLQRRFPGLSEPVIACEWHDDTSLAVLERCLAEAQSYHCRRKR